MVRGAVAALSILMCDVGTAVFGQPMGQAPFVHVEGRE